MGMRGGQLLVKAEKALHPLPRAGEGLRAVAQNHRPVQFRMGFDQCRRHGERVIYKSASNAVFVGQTSGLPVCASSKGVAADRIPARAPWDWEPEAPLTDVTSQTPRSKLPHPAPASICCSDCSPSSPLQSGKSFRLDCAETLCRPD